MDTGGSQLQAQASQHGPVFKKEVRTQCPFCGHSSFSGCLFSHLLSVLCWDILFPLGSLCDMPHIDALRQQSTSPCGSHSRGSLTRVTSWPSCKSSIWLLLPRGFFLHTVGMCGDGQPLPLGAGQVCEQGSGLSTLRAGLTGSEPRASGVAIAHGRVLT